MHTWRIFKVVFLGDEALSEKTLSYIIDFIFHVESFPSRSINKIHGYSVYRVSDIFLHFIILYI